MAALPKFSFTGWNSQSLAPKVNPAAVAPPTLEKVNLRGTTSSNVRRTGAPLGIEQTAFGSPGASIEGGMSIDNGIVYQNGKPIGPIGSPAAMALGVTSSGSTGQLVGQTNAANTNLPAWLQAEVDRLNAQDALRTQMAGQVTGGGAPTQNIGDILQGVAAVTGARSQFNTSLNQINEQARLQNLIQQRSQLRPTGGFGFNDPTQVPRMLDLERQISGYQNVNLPLAAGAVGGFRSSGWVNPFRTF